MHSRLTLTEHLLLFGRIRAYTRERILARIRWRVASHCVY